MSKMVVSYLKYFFSIILLLSFTMLLAEDDKIIPQKKRVTIQPFYQTRSITDSLNSTRDISEYSTTFSLYMPFTRNFSMALWGAQANTYGDVKSLSGITDVQLSTSYQLPDLGTVFSLKLNLPSGKKELENDAFNTSTLMSNTVFKLKIPNMGQGLNVSSGVIWAKEISESFVSGLGFSYQYKGEYQPKAVSDKLNPGDEFLITAGFDFRLNASATISSDVVFTSYNKDKFGDTEVFKAGQKISIAMLYRQFFKFNELRGFLRYRSQGKNDLITLDSQSKLVPNHLHTMVHYRQYMSKYLTTGIQIEGRFYETLEAVSLTGGNLWGFALLPEITFSETVKMPLYFKVITGDFQYNTRLSGLNIGTGLTFLF